MPKASEEVVAAAAEEPMEEPEAASPTQTATDKGFELALLRERVAQLEAQLSRPMGKASARDLPGVPTSEARTEYFSPAEVRAMSQREVRENYDRIFESMRHWQ